MQIFIVFDVSLQGALTHHIPGFILQQGLAEADIRTTALGWASPIPPAMVVHIIRKEVKRSTQGTLTAPSIGQLTLECNALKKPRTLPNEIQASSVGLAEM